MDEIDINRGNRERETLINEIGRLDMGIGALRTLTDVLDRIPSSKQPEVLKKTFGK